MTNSKGFDGEAFYAALAQVVDERNVSWKQVAESTGVSASTLTRMAQGRKPDAASLASLSAWSGLNPADFVEGVETAPKKADTVTQMVALLRADKSLTPEAKRGMEATLRNIYAMAPKR